MPELLSTVLFTLSPYCDWLQLSMHYALNCAHQPNAFKMQLSVVGPQCASSISLPLISVYQQFSRQSGSVNCPFDPDSLSKIVRKFLMWSDECQSWEPVTGSHPLFIHRCATCRWFHTSPTSC